MREPGAGNGVSRIESMSSNMITLTLKGIENGDMVDFEGGALQMPGVTFKAILTRIAD